VEAVGCHKSLHQDLADSAALKFEIIRRKKEVHNNCRKKSVGGTAARSIIRGTLALSPVLAASGMVYAQEKGQENKEQANFSSIPSPTTSIPPPAGNSVFLLGHGVRHAGYVCLPPAWAPLPGPSTVPARSHTFHPYFGEAGADHHPLPSARS